MACRCAIIIEVGINNNWVKWSAELIIDHQNAQSLWALIFLIEQFKKKWLHLCHFSLGLNSKSNT